MFYINVFHVFFFFFSVLSGIWFNYLICTVLAVQSVAPQTV